MRALIFFALALSGCNTPAGYDVRGGKLCRIGVDGRCYHIGHEWAAFRFDRNYNLHRVK